MAANDPFWVFVGPLNQAGIRYMVTGATAAIIYGAPRLTNDLDLVVELRAEEAEHFVRSFPEDLFYVSPTEVVAMEAGRASRGHVNIIEHETGFKADVYFAARDPLHHWALARRRDFGATGRPLWIAPPEYVVLRKLEYFREGGSQKHLSDISSMLSVSGGAIDRSWIAAEAAERGLLKEWKQAQEWR